MNMQRYQHRSLQHQKGVAAIWMGLMLVPIMGFTFWAVEGTRYVQETSRLRDSAEAAALAVTIEDQPARADGLAMRYVENYVRDIESSELIAQRFHQAENQKAGILEYIQYTVNAKTTHDSWFASSFIPSFNTKQDLAGRSLARKYPVYLGDNNIDIVFVSDFSGSMNWTWGQNRSRKIDDLKRAIREISDKILCKPQDSDANNGHEASKCNENNGDLADKVKNRIGIVPYNIRTREKQANGAVSAVSQLRYKTGVDVLYPERTFESVNWNKWRRYSSRQVYNCSRDRYRCPNRTNSERYEARRVVQSLGIRAYSNRRYTVDTYKYVDFSATVSQMMTNHFPAVSTYYRVDNNALYSGFGDSSFNQFHNITLTNNIDNLASLNSMRADGSTAAFQGILRGAQVLADGNPNSSDTDEQQAYNQKIKMMLILSDGQESPNNHILKGLVDAGMCNKARQQIPGLYIGVIGINFQASQQSGFQDCVVDPSEDIIDVSNLDELIKKIEELIRKGSKTSGITKLY